MNKTDYLENFYCSILDFLIKNKLEISPEGYSEEEIIRYEKLIGVTFPKAYRLFLFKMAKSKLKIYDHQDFSLSGLNYASEVSKELLELDKNEISPNQFVFAQWQGYNFYHFKLNSENPNVELYIQAGCAFDGSPAEKYNYGPFTDWLCRKIKISLNLRNQLEGLEINSLLIELDKIKADLNKIT